MAISRLLRATDLVFESGKLTAKGKIRQNRNPRFENFLSL